MLINLLDQCMLLRDCIPDSGKQPRLVLPTAKMGKISTSSPYPPVPFLIFSAVLYGCYNGSLLLEYDSSIRAPNKVVILTFRVQCVYVKCRGQAELYRLH